VSLETITGQVRTVTVTPTVPPSSLNLNGAAKNGGGGGGGGLSTGGAVGLTIGLVVLIATIASMAWYYMRKRKQEKEEAFANLSRANSVTGQLGSAGGGVPSRTMSENSRYVLGTNGRQVVETWEPENGRQNRLVPVDPRLDPFAPLYQRDNLSRDSVNTLRDDHDYSRRVQQPRPVLRVNNPDSE
jgi:cell wall integrity and stress response component